MTTGDDVRRLTHLDDRGRARMVDVGSKPITRRVATAQAIVTMSPATAGLLADGKLPKGDALPVVRLAGIQAAKRTHELIPLCHPLRLDTVDVDVEINTETGRVGIVSMVVAHDRTGVEMEALTAATVAALCLYDLVKAVQRDVSIGEVLLLAKQGGRSGDYHH